MMDEVPSCSTLKRNVKCVKEETLEKIHHAVLAYAADSARQARPAASEALS